MNCTDVEKEIELYFIVLPTHTSLQDKVNDFGLSKERGRFLSDLTNLATVYNLDYKNKLTEKIENFSDPFHLKREFIESVVSEIWGPKRKRQFVRLYYSKMDTD